MFQGYFNNDLRKFQGRFREDNCMFFKSKEASKFQGCFELIFKGVSRKFQGRFNKLSRVFHRSFQGVSGKFQGCLKKVSRKFQGYSRKF